MLSNTSNRDNKDNAHLLNLMMGAEDDTSEVYIEPAEEPSEVFIEPVDIPSIVYQTGKQQELPEIEPELTECRGKIRHAFCGEASLTKMVHILDRDPKEQQEFLQRAARGVVNEHLSLLQRPETSCLILDLDFPKSLRYLERQASGLKGLEIEDITGYEGNLTDEDRLEQQEYDSEYQRYSDELQEFKSKEQKYKDELNSFYAIMVKEEDPQTKRGMELYYARIFEEHINELKEEKDRLKKWCDDLAKRYVELERKHSQLKESLMRDTFAVFKNLTRRLRKDLIRLITAELEKGGIDKRVGIMGEFHGKGGIGEIHSLHIGDKDYAIKIHFNDLGLDYNKYERLRKATKESEHQVTYHDSAVMESNRNCFGPEIQFFCEKDKKTNRTRIDFFEELKGYQHLPDFLSVKNLNIRNSAQYTEDFIFFMESIFIPVLKGVKDFHDRGLAHLDLKPANTFVKPNKRGELTVKVGDIDSSRDPNRFSCDYIAGTLKYMSPEYNTGVINLESDIYSLGIMLYLILNKKRTKGNPNPTLCASERTIELIKKCTNEDPAKRPTIDELITGVHALINEAKEMTGIESPAIEVGDHDIEDEVYIPGDDELIDDEDEETMVKKVA